MFLSAWAYSFLCDILSKFQFWVPDRLKTLVLSTGYFQFSSFCSLIYYNIVIDIV